ncbi:uncharacterized protein LOC126048486 [Accipiter gentilis]|uniref:uncharacterized protein LOC126048486 n=1 Tax=Astur gentilis TaxID=8957 RepID=UPI0021109FB2|nr:uncharacterized protein LOC126048486 [Accipiter gentilis]
MGSVQPCLSSCPRAAWALHGRVAGSDIQWRAHRSLCLAKAALALLGEGICGFRGVMYPARLPQHSPSPALRGAPGLWARMAPWGAGSPCPQAAVSRERAGKREACDGWWEHREWEAQGVCSKGKARSAPAIWPCPRQVGWPVSKLLQLQSFKEHPRGKGEITNLTGQFGVNVESQSNKSPADCSGEGRLRGWAGCEPTEHRGSQGSSRALQTSAMPSIKGDARGQSNVGWRLSKAGKGQIGKGVPSSWVQEEETTSRQQKQRGAQE